MRERKGLQGCGLGRPWGGSGAAWESRGKTDRKGAKGKGRWKREMTAGARKAKENTREAAKPSGNLL